MKFIINYAYSFYLGIALAVFADISFLQWEFYIIVFPVIVFVRIRHDYYRM